MLSLAGHSKSRRPVPQFVRLAQRAGFTLAEVVIALAVLGTMAAGCYTGFNSINTFAVSSRLYTEAQTAAQNQVDLVLSKEPFDITAAYVSGTFNPALNKIPIELMTVSEIDALAASGVTFPTAPPTSVPAVTSPYFPYYPYYRKASGQPILKQAFIYQDPVTGTVVVTGTVTSTVTDVPATMTFVSANTNLNIRRVTASITYTFRSKDYTVAMDTLRTADQ
jgi:prepilin-type N-terminal cleavage/methylation domain-containing protein